MPKSAAAAGKKATKKAGGGKGGGMWRYIGGHPVFIGPNGPEFGGKAGKKGVKAKGGSAGGGVSGGGGGGAGAAGSSSKATKTTPAVVKHPHGEYHVKFDHSKQKEGSDGAGSAVYSVTYHPKDGGTPKHVGAYKGATAAHKMADEHAASAKKGAPPVTNAGPPKTFMPDPSGNYGKSGGVSKKGNAHGSDAHMAELHDELSNAAGASKADFNASLKRHAKTLGVDKETAKEMIKAGAARHKAPSEQATQDAIGRSAMGGKSPTLSPDASHTPRQIAGAARRYERERKKNPDAPAWDDVSGADKQALVAQHVAQRRAKKDGKEGSNPNAGTTISTGSSSYDKHVQKLTAQGDKDVLAGEPGYVTIQNKYIGKDNAKIGEIVAAAAKGQTYTPPPPNRGFSGGGGAYHASLKEAIQKSGGSLHKVEPTHLKPEHALTFIDKATHQLKQTSTPRESKSALMSKVVAAHRHLVDHGMQYVSKGKVKAIKGRDPTIPDKIKA